MSRKTQPRKTLRDQPKKSLRDVNVSGVRALVRVDLNVPLTLDGSDVSDDSRIQAVLPTIEHLREAGARIVLCSHLARPKGRVADEMRLAPVRKRLSQLLDLGVADAGGPAGAEPKRICAGLGPGDVALLENLRFDPREEANDDGLARELAALGDLFVNDAFGAAHRAHASTVGVASHLPAVAGLLMARELEMLGRVIDLPEHPVVAVVGGAKVSDKLAVITNLARRVDKILIGGGMVTAFAAALGHGAGSAEVSAEEVDAARSLLDNPDTSIVTPVDAVTATEALPGADAAVYPVGDLPADALILDIGPETASRYADEIMKSRTIIWNGPMGVFEWPAFAGGTQVVASAIASNRDAISVAGGGSTAEAIGELGLYNGFTHVSTGGGAALEFMEGKVLPGVAALDDLQA